MLIVGMFTEAFVFLVSAFDPPADDYEWERVYPALADEFAKGAQQELERDETRSQHEREAHHTGQGLTRRWASGSDGPHAAP